MKLTIKSYLSLIALFCLINNVKLFAQSPAAGTVTFTGVTTGSLQSSTTTGAANYVRTTGGIATGQGLEFTVKSTASGNVAITSASVSFNQALGFTRGATSVNLSEARIRSARTGSASGTSTTLNTPGDPFSIVSLNFLLINTGSVTLTLTGYRAGVSVGTTSVTVTSTTTKKAVTFPSAFTNIDDVVITGFGTGTATNLGQGGIYVDDIVIANAPPAISYLTPQVYTAYTAITPLAPTVIGTVDAYGYSGTPTVFATASGTPYSVATDASGSVYAIDYGNKSLTKYSSTGVSTIINNTSMTGPVNLAIDPSGFIYVSDWSSNNILKFSSTGTLLATFTGFNSPYGLASDLSGNIYVADNGSNSIIKITAGQSGTVAITAANTYVTGITGPYGITLDRTGNMYVSRNAANSIVKVSSGSTTAVNFLTTGLNGPRNMSTDAGGNLYVADYGSSKIIKVTAAGVASTLVSGLNGPRDVAIDPNGTMYIANSDGNNILTTAETGGYAISGFLPSGLNFDTVTGSISGTPTASSPATNYTITAYNSTGSGTYTVNITVNNAPIEVTDANTSANGITQGTLHPGQTGAVLFGYSFKANSSMTVNGFNINANFGGGNGAGFYFTNGQLYKNTSANTFSGAVPVTGALVAFTYNATNAAVTVTGLSETYTASTSPVYYFIVADIAFNYNTLNAASQTIQFVLTTSQTSAVTSSTPSGNYAPNINVNGTTFTIAPPTITVTNNNFTANGITTSNISYGQTGIVLFSFKAAVDGVVNVNQFDIPSNVTVNPYFLNGKIYRSTTQNFADAVPVTGTVSFSGTNTSVTGMAEALSSYDSSGGAYYYFLVGDLTNPNAAAATINFKLASATVAFTESSPYLQLYPSANITGLPFTILTTYVWTGPGTNFNAAANYRTLTNGTIGTAPSTTSNVYFPSGVSVVPALTAAITVGVLTFETKTAAPTPTPSINVATFALTISKNLVVAPNTTATVTGTTGTISLSATATSSSIGAGASLTLNSVDLTLVAGSVLEMEPTSTLNLTSGGTVTNNGTFTLRSDATGSASIGQITTAGQMAGKYNVERYVSGGAAKYRGYRLISSPTNITSATTTPAYIDMSSITDAVNINSKGAYTGGPGSNFTINQPTPSIYLYDETATASTTSFNSGKHKGLTELNNAGLTTASVNIAGGLTVAQTITNRQVPVGNGFIYYNIGPTNQTNPTPSGTVPLSYAFTQKGYLNQGNVVVRLWYTPTGGAGKLSYSSSLGTSAGYNMVGNPYAAPIDLNLVYGTNNPTIETYVYELGNDNSAGQNYMAWNRVGQSDPAATQYIASGQGFIVKAKTTASTLTFTEAMKYSGTQPTAITFLSTAPIANNPTAGFFMKMELDSINYDYCGIYFNKDYADTYSSDEDVIDIDGASPKVYMSSYTADTRRAAINANADYKSGKTIKLYTNGTVTGAYKLKMEQLKNFDPLYDIWLMDNFKKDSVNLKINPVYSFNVNRSDATTYGADRFKIVVRRKPLPVYQFLTLTGAVAGQAINLNWKTVNEADYTGFTVEKLNTNKQYDPLTNIQSTGVGSYTFTDRTPNKGVNTYRIKQDDIDGKITYSTDLNILDANDVKSKNFTIYPNPIATTTLNVKFINVLKESVNIMVSSASGNVMSTAVFTQQEGTIDVSKLKTGIYFIKATTSVTGQEIGAQQFIKL